MPAVPPDPPAIHFMAKNTSRSASADDTTDPAVQGASTADASGVDALPKPRTRRKKADSADTPPVTADTPVAEAPAEKPAPRPRRTPAARKVAEPAAPEVAASAPPEAAEAAPKPRRTRAKATPEDAGTPVEAAPSSAAPDSAEAPKKPRRTRAKAAEAAPQSAAPEAGTPGSDAPSTNTASADAPAPTRRRTRTARIEPVASSDNLPESIVRDTEPPRDAPRPDDRRDAPRDDRARTDRPRDERDERPRDDRPRDDRGQAERFRDDRPNGGQVGGPAGGPNAGGPNNGARYDDGFEGGGRRNKRKRNKNRGQNGPGGYPNGQGGQNNGPPQGAPPYLQGGGQPQFQGGQPQFQGGGNQGGQQANQAPAEPFEGILELIGDKKFGFVRQFTTSLLKGDNDPFMPPPFIQKYGLRDGVTVKGMVRPGRKGAWQVVELTDVMGGAPEDWEHTPDFDAGLVVYPDEKLRLVTGPSDIAMRVVDLVAPIGKGQRGLIVAPPRAGKTILIKQIAAGLSQNHPDVKLVALLIDERPEEVTDFRRNTNATVFASSNDYGEDNHVRVATIAFEYARRLVEQGHDVVILLDSLTRLGRTFNMFGANLSGRTMSGGLDARALLVPRKIFGAARNIENGGSLTIVATALIETGSRMDDVIFEEFKGTGNSEIVLDREMSEQRIYPAINIRKSGTRNEDRLVDPDLLRQRHMLLRALNSRHPVEAMQALAKQLQLSGSNEELLQALVPE
jgi:transcription termination factor Rho